MKIPNQREVQQRGINFTSDTDCKDYINLYKKCTAKPYSYIASNAILASDNPLHLRSNYLERMLELIMTIDGKIKDK